MIATQMKPTIPNVNHESVKTLVAVKDSGVQMVKKKPLWLRVLSFFFVPVYSPRNDMDMESWRRLEFRNEHYEPRSAMESSFYRFM